LLRSWEHTLAIVPLLEHVVAKQPQPIFCSNFYVRTYMKQKNKSRRISFGFW